MLKVHVIDDDEMSRQTACMALDDLPVEAHEWSSGSLAVGAIGGEESHDIVLLDIEMPGMDGLEVCRRLRGAGQTRLNIIFVSSHDDLETRLAAYEAGGNDFVIKPYDVAQLHYKLRVILDQESKRLAISEQVNYATRTAFTAMTSMGELGQALEFLRNCLRHGDTNAVARSLLDTVASYGLQALVQIRGGETLNLGPDGPCSELELSIMNHAADTGRIFTIGNRMAVNYPHVTLLSSGLPKDDPDRIGRLRDHLAIIVEAADARVEVLANEARRLRQAKGIIEVAGLQSRTLGEVETTYRNLREQTKQIGEQLMYSQERTLFILNLPQSQQSELMALAHDAVSRIANLQLRAEEAAQRLHSVTEQLEVLVKEVN